VPSLKQLQEALEPYLGERTEAVLREGAARLRLQKNKLSKSGVANLLKRVVYLELQREMDAASAKKVVKNLLANISEQAQPKTKEGMKSELQAALSRFSLYFEWPEVQRLRSLAALIKANESEGQSASELLLEAKEQIDLLDEKLQNALLRQARDISDLEEAVDRVKSIGGPKLRRLQSLLKQIKEAQAADTLATAEVERARKLAADMRKLVESSVVQNPTLVPEPAEQKVEEDISAAEVKTGEEQQTSAEENEFELLIDFESLEPEVADRIREIDLAEERRRLEMLKEQFAPVWNAKNISNLVQEIENQLDNGEPAGDKIDQLHDTLKEAIKDALADARARYEWLSERLRTLDLEGGLNTERARSQLDLIKENLDKGVLPSDLEEAQHQIKSLEDALAKRRAEEARRARILEEANSLLANAREALSGEDLPELSGFRQRLAQLEENVDSGEVDEALLARLKSELPDVLNQIAKAGEASKALRAGLIAEIESLPPLEELKPSINALRSQADEMPLEELKAAVSELRQQTQVLSRATLEELVEKANRFGAGSDLIENALAELENGALPDLEKIQHEIEANIAAKQTQVRQQLESLAASARRLEGMGGEDLLPEIEAALQNLDTVIPDTSSIKNKLDQLIEKREILRSNLGKKYQDVTKRYQRAKSVGGETVYRTQTLLNYLEKGADRLSRLGSSGLLEFQRALGEAEKLVQQLEEEYEAAKQVAQQLQDADLGDLLGVFDSPETEPEGESSTSVAAGAPTDNKINEDELAPFRIRGVLWAHKITPDFSASNNIDAPLIHAFIQDLELLREEVGADKIKNIVITFSNHVLLITTLSDDPVVIFAERALLSRLLSLLARHY